MQPRFQGRGVGSALVRAVLAAADELGEALVVLVGDPAYYGRFGFVPASDLGIEGTWGAYLQALPLAAHDPALRGRLTEPAPFRRLAAGPAGPEHDRRD